jgi:hypothetical protein
VTVTTIVVDDHLLIRMLLGDEPADLRPTGAEVFTTGLWYHRLCRAVAVPSVTGSLSRLLGGATAEASAAAMRAITELPEHVGLLSLRELAWPMARLLDDGVRLNLMSLEALAAAERVGADLCMATVGENPQLMAAAGSRGVRVRLI